MILLKNVSSSLVKDYENKSLSKMDELNFGNILLLSNPTNFESVKYRSINYTSLAKVKKYLMPREGGIVKWPWCTKIGNSDVPKIVTAVDLYTDQIEKQSKLTNNRRINLFEYQNKEKQEIVMDKYADIIDYLLCTTKEELLWSKLTDAQRKVYLSSIKINHQVERKTREKMIEYISNYTTLEELENLEKENYKVLNKFIKR